MNKVFYLIGIYSTCVFVHDVISRIAKREAKKLNKKGGYEEGEMSYQVTYACGFEVDSESYDYSDEEDHKKLDRIGF